MPDLGSGGEACIDSGVKAEKLSGTLRPIPPVIIFSRWDTVGTAKARVLVQILENGVVQVWDTQDLQGFTMLLHAKIASADEGDPVCVGFLPASTRSPRSCQTEDAILGIL